MLWFEARLDHRTGPLAWLAVGVVDLAAVVLVAVPRRWPWATSVLAILPAGVALGAGLVTGSTLDVRVDWVPPLLAALASGVLLALGVALHQRGLSAGAALALSGSAIACAFRLGGVVAGVVVLVLCGAALLGLATALRQKEAAA
jgi:hypothetical protein